LSFDIKIAAARTIGASASFYVRKAPWTLGKRMAFDLFTRYLGWRRYGIRTRTTFGDLMELEFPDLVSRIIYLTGQWEPMITQYVRETLRQGDVFIDVGANLGYYTLLASRIVGNSGKVIAIEASPYIAARLRRNIELNACRNVRIVNAAVSDSKGEVQLFAGQDTNLGNTTTVESLATRNRLKASGAVQAETLEMLVGRTALQCARLIKVDVEGAELAVVRTVFPSLGTLQADWILELTPSFCAGGQSDVEAILSFFRRAGYRAYSIPNGYSVDFVTNPTGFRTLLDVAPTTQCDVLMTRTAFNTAPAM
jgi:FkbM family methyltransferase